MATIRPVIRSIACIAGLFAFAPRAVTASELQPRPSLRIEQPHANDCSLTLGVPPLTDPRSIRITLNSPDAPLTFTVAQRDPFVVLFTEPLPEGSDITVTVGSDVAHARVAPATGGPPTGPTCGRPAEPPPSKDDRSVFEASGYLGRVFDNFAPNIVGGYRNIEGSSGTQWRWTAGIEAQYRLFGGQDSSRQFWLATQTLHGVRSADVDCKKTPSVAVCGTSNTSDKFLYILEHASTMEAHLDARFEFARLQDLSEMPIKVYAIARFGFLDLERAPKVFNSDSLGIGIISPKGIFRGSSAQVAWGHSQQFQSNPGWNRLKINGVLVFDLVTTPVSAAENIMKRIGGGSRFFIAIAVDRNPGGIGPDCVQTYVGVDFDLRRVFASFGG